MWGLDFFKGKKDIKKGIRNIELTNTASQIKMIVDFANNICEIPYYSIISPMLSSRLTNFRIKNLEDMVANISKKLEEHKDKIDKSWYDGIEAIKIFKKLIEEIELEEAQEKIKVLSNVFVKFSYKEYKNDKNKIIIISKLAELSISQMEVLKSINEAKKICFKNGGRDIIEDDLKDNLSERGVLNKIENLYYDLGLLNSLGLIEWAENRSPSIFINQLGKMVVKYL